MSSRPHVCVVGDVGLDVVTKLAGPVVLGNDTRAAVTIAPGGAGGNTAAWLATYDVDVSLISRVGDDEAGRTAAAELSKTGVACRFSIDPQLPTCCVVVLVDGDGERTMWADRGANAAFAPADVRLPTLSAGQRGHLHLSGYVLLDNNSRPAGLAALAAAKQAGWTTSVDPQAAVHVKTVGGQAFLTWISGTDLLLPNDPELIALGGTEAALAHVGAVVVTHGANGASWITVDAHERVPVPVRHATDFTGAGDAFNAGLLATWLAGAPIGVALAAGVRAGTSATARIGARPD